MANLLAQSVLQKAKGVVPQSVQDSAKKYVPQTAQDLAKTAIGAKAGSGGGTKAKLMFLLGAIKEFNKELTLAFNVLSVTSALVSVWILAAIVIHFGSAEDRLPQNNLVTI